MIADIAFHLANENGDMRPAPHVPCADDFLSGLSFQPADVLDELEKG
jgi:hypothetical protein